MCAQGAVGTLSRAPTAYPASADSVPITAISSPLRPGCPTVSLLLYAPIPNSTSAVTNTEAHMLVETDRNRNGASGTSDPITAEELSRLSYDPLVGDGWKWTEKRRFYVDSYKMVQYDIINPAPYVPKIQEKIKEAYVRARNETDAVVVCDNRHGTMMHELIDLVVQKKSRYGGKLFVDSQVSQHGSNHSFYRGADMMFLNGKELDSIPQSRLVADDLMRKLKVVSNSLQSGVTLKRGEKGSATFFPSEDYVESPAYPVKAVDTCGAGDAFLAAYAVSEDLGFANRWAGLSTTYYGTVVPQQET